MFNPDACFFLALVVRVTVQSPPFSSHHICCLCCLFAVRCSVSSVYREVSVDKSLSPFDSEDVPTMSTVFHDLIRLDCFLSFFFVSFHSFLVHVYEILPSIHLPFSAFISSYLELHITFLNNTLNPTEHTLT